MLVVWWRVRWSRGGGERTRPREVEGQGAGEDFVGVELPVSLAS